jgi:hypothetical protein
MFATNNAPAGATFHAITNGFEFLMGFTTLNITDIAGPSAVASLNWKIPGFHTPPSGEAWHMDGWRRYQ